MKYVSLIVDIKNSKHYKDRRQLQEKILKELEILNCDYKEELKLEFTITLGDEFQALFLKADKIFEVILLLRYRLKEVNFRVGIGIGSIDTNFLSNKALGTDGSVWWNARDAINELKAIEKGLRYNSTIRVKGISRVEIEELINMSLSLLNTIENRFSKRQIEITNKAIDLYGISSHFSQVDFSKTINEDVKSINKILNNAKYYDYIKSYTLLANLINKELL